MNILQSKAAINAIKECDGVTLNIGQMSLTSLKGLGKVLEQHGKLGIKNLFIDYNSIKSLKHLPLLENLEWLAINHNKLKTLKHLPKFPKLRGVYAQHNKLTDVSGASVLTTLSRLEVSHNKLSDFNAVLSLKLDFFNYASDTLRLTFSKQTKN